MILHDDVLILCLAGNNVTGIIPSEIGNMNSLEYMVLGEMLVDFRFVFQCA